MLETVTFPEKLRTSPADIPPLSVLDARAGAWQSRKRLWLSLGIRSEIGRDAKTYNLGLKANPENRWTQKDNKGSGISIFDPVLTELAYRWWCPPGGVVLDPFAGGSVRGLMAAFLGRKYWGCDLSAPQVFANAEQAEEMTRRYPDFRFRVKWKSGDSAVELDNAPAADFVFSCPPYGNLEKYSDHPADLSNQKWEGFSRMYREIIRKCGERLKPNRLAAFVVGEYRDARGGYVGLVPETVAAFRDAGLDFFTETRLMTMVGSLSLRTTKQFQTTRKLGKTHQNVLVFVKGDPIAAVDNLEGIYGTA